MKFRDTPQSRNGEMTYAPSPLTTATTRLSEERGIYAASM
jgi:hypothetical protein